MPSYKKTLVHHRALNSRKNLKNYNINLKKNSDFFHAAEGDLCWDTTDPECVYLYMFHPGITGKALNRQALINGLRKKKLLSVESLFKKNNKIRYVIELKSGSGRIEPALLKLNQLIQAYRVEHVTIDAFCLNQLKIAKKFCPDVQTSLHTKFIFDKTVLETSYRFPYIAFRNIYDLSFIDIITVSYDFSQANLFNLDINKCFAHVFLSGKTLNLGAVKTITQFNRADKSLADAFYLRSPEIIAHLLAKGA